MAAAARIYFDKPIDELDLGEMALLAGLVRAPSRFSPLTSLDAARTRRDQVLAAMVASGYLTDDEANRWRARPVTIRQRPDFFHTVSPYFAEHVRRDIIRRYGEKKLYEGGLDIETSVLPWIDIAGQENVDFSLRKLDKRQGWRGPVVHLTGAAADEFRRRVAAHYGGEPPAEGRLYLGLVEGATADGNTACASAATSTCCRPPTCCGRALERQGRRQRQEARVDRGRAARRRRRLGEERAPVEAARASPTGPTTARARSSGCLRMTRPPPARRPSTRPASS